MPKFIKRPIEIEAIQIIQHGRDRVALAGFADWISEAIAKHDKEEGHLCLSGLHCFVVTKEGVMRGKAGDWLIRGVEGELYLCDGAIFAKTYIETDMHEPPPAIDTGKGREPLSSEIERLINEHNRENVSDTPDFILAQFLMQSLEAFEAATNWRTKWYGGNGNVQYMPGTLSRKNLDEAAQIIARSLF